MVIAARSRHPSLVAMERILDGAGFEINAYNPATQFGRTEQSRPDAFDSCLRHALKRR
jgi:hypothetical protein